MTMKVKGLPWPKCDKVLDAIKASHNSMGVGKKKKRLSHGRDSQEEKFYIIVNLIRVLEGVSRQLVWISFTREKETSLLFD